MSAEVARALRFWRSVELFSPQRVPGKDPPAGVLDLGYEDQLPWQRGDPGAVKPRRGEKWRHEVFLGVFEIRRVFEILSLELPVREVSRLGRARGETALMSFLVDQDGYAIRGTETVSSCAWGLGRSRDPGPGDPGWLEGFREFSQWFAEFFADLTELPNGDVDGAEDTIGSRLVDGALLEECLASTVAGAGIGGAVEFQPVMRIRSFTIRQSTKKTSQSSFLNSFILDDLHEVSDSVADGAPSGALATYLSPVNPKWQLSRVDVRERLDVARRLVAPDRVPLGRWPADSGELLSLGQQLAVNEAFQLVDREGMIAVNGPPGTGKTTLLRDLVAGLVTERAGRLAALRHPGDAFLTDKLGWRTNSWSVPVHRLKPEFTGFEVVVASSNNGAVENVTFEMPRLNQIGEDWVDEALGVGYFPDLATAAMKAQEDSRSAGAVDGDGEELGDSRPRGAGSSEAWGLIAARLGRRQNCRQFFDAVSWDAKAPHTAGENQPVLRTGLRSRLMQFENTYVPAIWAEAVERFAAARQVVEALADQRSVAHRALDDIARARQERDDLRRQVNRDASVVERHAAQRQAARAAAERATDASERNLLVLEHHAHGKPGVLRWRARAQWADEHQEMSRQGFTLAAAADQARAARDELVAAEGELQRLRQELDQADERLRHMAEQLAASVAAAGHLVPDEDWERDLEVRERTAPWLDQRWNDARTRLFIEAMRLHLAFLQGAARQMRQNLHAVELIAKGQAPDQLRDEALAAWQSLFLAVPVASTTFASAGRLFRHLQGGELGWLLIDEAGQATPQNPVGMLWRARRAVIVGDPLQLPPVHTVPEAVEQALIENANLDEEWLTSTSSAQLRADARNDKGTSLPSGENGELWVGLPLLVHRRCDQPMFDIANTIAYGGQMQHATGAKKRDQFVDAWPHLPASCWYDVPASSSRGHVRDDETSLLDDLLARLFESGLTPKDVMAISPFADIGKRLKGFVEKYEGLVAGTIHTSQGKEADIVFLILGSDVNGSGGDRDWATQAPNLLNVAVSRAKRRLYVIGDIAQWQEHKHCSTIAEHLQHTPTTPRITTSA